MVKKVHDHELQKLTHTAIMDLHPGSYYSWNCDGRKYPTLCPAQDLNTNDMDVVYHDSKNNYDMCENCVAKYKSEEVVEV